MTRRTPGRTAGYDNRRPIRSPFIPLRNTPITGWNKPDRYTSRLTAQRARYHHEIRARSKSGRHSQAEVVRLEDRPVREVEAKGLARILIVRGERRAGRMLRRR